MGGGIVRCVKILALLSLVPLALRAGSLLGHVVAPPPSSPRPSAVTKSAGVVSGSAHGKTSAALGAARFRSGGGVGGFGDDKRMAPSGSNPLHNLR